MLSLAKDSDFSSETEVRVREEVILLASWVGTIWDVGVASGEKVGKVSRRGGLERGEDAKSEGVTSFVGVPGNEKYVYQLLLSAGIGVSTTGSSAISSTMNEALSLSLSLSNSQKAIDT